MGAGGGEHKAGERNAPQGGECGEGSWEPWGGSGGAGVGRGVWKRGGGARMRSFDLRLCDIKGRHGRIQSSAPTYLCYRRGFKSPSEYPLIDYRNRRLAPDVT